LRIKPKSKCRNRHHFTFYLPKKYMVNNRGLSFTIYRNAFAWYIFKFKNTERIVYTYLNFQTQEIKSIYLLTKYIRVTSLKQLSLAEFSGE
jgi:hypothetical protein